MDRKQQTQEYEDALAEERLLWKQLHDEPQADVNEQVKAFASWSAAAERARSIAARRQEGATAGEPAGSR